MDGILYLLNLTGQALAQANQEIERLRARVAELEAQQAPPDPPRS